MRRFIRARTLEAGLEQDLRSEDRDQCHGRDSADTRDTIARGCWHGPIAYLFGRGLDGDSIIRHATAWERFAAILPWARAHSDNFPKGYALHFRQGPGGRPGASA